MAYTLTIAGIAKSIEPGWNITRPVNGVGTMSCAVHSRDGSYIPDLDDEIILERNGDRLFGGVITEAVTHGVNGPTAPIRTDVTAQDFNTYATRRYSGDQLPAGTLKDAIEALHVLLTPYSITIDVTQADGPSLPVLDYPGWIVKDIFDDLSRLTGWPWTIDYDKVLRFTEPGTVDAPFDIAVGNGNAIGDVVSKPTRWQYANQVIVWGNGVNAVASDAGEISANNYWDALIVASDADTQDQVDAIAAGELAARLPTQTEVRYTTRQHGLFPGMTQTIVVPARGINNTFIVQDVEAEHVGLDLVDYRIQALGGGVIQRGWREGVAGWGGSGSSNALPSIGQGGGGSGAVRFTYHLGGEQTTAIRSETPDWIDVSPMQVQINTVSRGTTSGQIVVMLKAYTAGVSVQARLWDVTLGAACTGTSTVVTSQSWTRDAFTVTLTAGNNFYKLQVLPSDADEDVYAMGYLV